MPADEKIAPEDDSFVVGERKRGKRFTITCERKDVLISKNSSTLVKLLERTNNYQASDFSASGVKREKRKAYTKEKVVNATFQVNVLAP